MLSQLIVLDPDKRLGHEQGCADIFSHPFFAQLDHSTPLWQQYSPYTPTASQATDGGTTAADQREMSLLLEDVDAAASGPDQSPGNASCPMTKLFPSSSARRSEAARSGGRRARAAIFRGRRRVVPLLGRC